MQREVWLINEGRLAVVAGDTFGFPGENVEVSTSWQGGHHLAWAFRDGWMRLSDGRHALWFGTAPGILEASALTRHPGSRGPLTVTHTVTLPKGQSVRWWVFWCDPAAGWTPPSVELRDGALRVKDPENTPAEWAVE